MEEIKIRTDWNTLIDVFFHQINTEKIEAYKIQVGKECKIVINYFFYNPKLQAFLHLMPSYGSDREIFITNPFSDYFINKRKPLINDEEISLISSYLSSFNFSDELIRQLKNKGINYGETKNEIFTKILTIFDRFNFSELKKLNRNGSLSYIVQFLLRFIPQNAYLKGAALTDGLGEDDFEKKGYAFISSDNKLEAIKGIHSYRRKNFHHRLFILLSKIESFQWNYNYNFFAIKDLHTFLIKNIPSNSVKIGENGFPLRNIKFYTYGTFEESQKEELSRLLAEVMIENLDQIIKFWLESISFDHLQNLRVYPFHKISEEFAISFGFLNFLNIKKLKVFNEHSKVLASGYNNNELMKDTDIIRNLFFSPFGYYNINFKDIDDSDTNFNFKLNDKILSSFYIDNIDKEFLSKRKPLLSTIGYEFRNNFISDSLNFDHDQWYRSAFCELYLKFDIERQKSDNEEDNFRTRNEEEKNYILEKTRRLYKSQEKECIKILDIGCGYGRVAEFLLDLKDIDFVYDGVDLSPYLLDYAKCKFENKSKFRFHHGDLIDFENIPEVKDSSYDIILCLYTSFGYFKENENSNLFMTIINHLNKDGEFILEQYNSEHFVNEIKNHCAISSLYDVQDVSLYKTGIFKKQKGFYDLYEGIYNYLKSNSLSTNLEMTEKNLIKCSYFNIKLYRKEWFEKHLNSEDIKVKPFYSFIEAFQDKQQEESDTQSEEPDITKKSRHQILEFKKIASTMIEQNSNKIITSHPNEKKWPRRKQ